MKITKAIVPAAGLGTRFLPVTKSIPKEMLPIIDKPILQYIIEELADSGIEEVMIVTSRNKEAIENHLDRNLEYENLLEGAGKLEELEMIKDTSRNLKIYYIRQGMPEGLGHAVKICKDFIGDEPFALLLGDEVYFGEEPATLEMTKIYEKTQCSVLCVGQVNKEEVSSYGIVEIDENSDSDYQEVTNLVEKPSIDQAPSNLAIYGRYILNPSIFKYLEEIKPGVGGEYQLTDALNLLVKKESLVSYEVKSKRYDVGSKLGYIMATLHEALADDKYKDHVLDFIENNK